MKWDYGADVLATVADGNGDLSLQSCAVVGITIVENSAQSEVFNSPIGTVLYTVEFSDGSDALVPEASLLPDRETASDA